MNRIDKGPRGEEATTDAPSTDELVKLLRDTIAADSSTRAIFDKAASDTRWPIIAQPEIGEQCKPDQDSQCLERGGDIPGCFDPRK
jgi:hypothetical protein